MDDQCQLTDGLMSPKSIKIEGCAISHSGLAALAAAAADETAQIPTNSNNKHTNRKTGADMKIFLSYLLSVNENRSPQNIPEVELDKHLCNFFMIVKKTDKTEYEPCSLRSMMASIERFLKINGYPSSLTRDSCFANTRYTLKLKQKVLREMGKGSKPQSPHSIASLKDKTLDRLFEAREMGPYSPTSVVQTLCFVFVVYLRLKKATEHKKLLWGDVILDRDQNGREYITFSDQMLQRCTLQYLKQCQPVVYALPDSPERDPVRIYKLYASKRISTMNYPYAPFYLGINVFNPADNQSWYKNIAMGINKLNDMVRQVREITGVTPTQQTTDDVNETPQDLSLTSSERNSRHSTPEPHLGSNNAFQIYKDFDLNDSVQDNDMSDNNSIKNENLQNLQSYRSSQRMLSYQPIYGPNIANSLHLENPSTFKVEPGLDSCDAMTDVDDDDDSKSGSSSDGNDVGDKVVEVEKGDQLETEVQSTKEESSPAKISFLDAQRKFEMLLNQLEAQELTKFKHWFKNIDIITDIETGILVCKERQECKNETTSSVKEQQIVLNITLSNKSFRGEQPVTVTATTKLVEVGSQEDATMCSMLKMKKRLSSDDGDYSASRGDDLTDLSDGKKQKLDNNK
ncbi:hypothetical protein LOTGIDRAFT_229375 [Lottia gigantea]|uniref:ZMYM2-like/QRICH1 C-terminal domain-containing protein n=1 Tax=Lottia gigantea TaxID=225164 RepID=V3Z8P5_LOTGI|nr:hypothetical protein LOTGIDRAFT_229375 [Lottia gigantea]ESO87288.1 hypothetical protein LOTGIDRAFT_229375 [Lottia gigantea]